MKFLLAIFLLSLSAMTLAATKFDCDFTGPNYTLTFDDNGNITLHNNLKSYVCQAGTTPLPGTEVDLKIFNCKSKFDNVVYFYGYDENGNIYLSKNLGSSNDVYCKKL